MQKYKLDKRWICLILALLVVLGPGLLFAGCVMQHCLFYAIYLTKSYNFTHRNYQVYDAEVAYFSSLAI